MLIISVDSHFIWFEHKKKLKLFWAAAAKDNQWTKSETSRRFFDAVVILHQPHMKRCLWDSFDLWPFGSDPHGSRWSSGVAVKFTANLVGELQESRRQQSEHTEITPCDRPQIRPSDGQVDLRLSAERLNLGQRRDELIQTVEAETATTSLSRADNNSSRPCRRADIYIMLSFSRWSLWPWRDIQFSTFWSDTKMSTFKHYLYL